MKALKNKLALCLAAALGLAVALAACSNSSDNGNLLLLSFGGSGSASAAKPGDYKVLPDGTVELGLWPQTIKADSVTVNESESKVVGDYTYYKGSDGEWYAKKSDKYYKVEPIVWKVLTSDYNGTGTKLLFSKKALVTQAWYDGDWGNKDTNDRSIDGHEDNVKPCNYKYSRARAYLNGLSYTKKVTTQSQVSFVDKGFLNTAFTGAQQGLIATTTVDNSLDNANGATVTGNRQVPLSSSTVGHSNAVCDNTQDKIFLLSQKEVTTEAYGFNPASSANDSARKFKAVDFAKGTYCNSSGEVTYWWLRSPCIESDEVKWVTIGYSLDGEVHSNAMGLCNSDYYYIVPALCLKAGN